MAEDVSVIYQQKEKSQRKNNRRGSQGTKMNKGKKKPDEHVNLTRAHKWKDNIQLSFGGMWRILNSLKDSNVSPSEGQRKREESGRAP